MDIQYKKEDSKIIESYKNICFQKVQFVDLKKETQTTNYSK